MRVQHINLMELPDSVLLSLTQENPVVQSEKGELEFISRTLNHHGSGYFNDLVVFSFEGKFFRFQATSYLDTEWSFTKPLEVFKEVQKRENTIYTTWYDVPDEDN